MKSNKNNRRSLFYSVISLLLCVSMLLGTTLAWFSDSVSSTGNIIKTGRLKVAMHYADDLSGEWKDASEATIFNGNYWEPGYSDMKYIKVSNTGNLAFSYQMHILPAVQAAAGEVNLADVIDVYVGVVGSGFVAPTAFSSNMESLSYMGTLSQVMAAEPMTGILLPEKGASGVLPEGVTADTGDVTYCVVLHMQEGAGNEYQNLSVGNNFTIQLVATQYGYEQDGFGGSYDEGSEYPDLKFPDMLDMDMGSAEVTVDGENRLTAAVTLKGSAISATVPAGVLLKPDTDKLTLTVELMDDTTSNITLGEGEEMRSLNVHVAGVSEENTVPMIISLGEVAPEYLNQGNLNLAHVEDGVTVPMTRVEDLAQLDAHNEFYYDVLTGELTVALATFSEVAMVADIPNAWNGGFDYSWYTGKKARSADYTIANADQLAAFGAIVGGMAENIDRDSFAGKTVQLLADIDLDDEDNANKELCFLPIGYYYKDGDSTVKSFEGEFDGNGHTIANFYQNTWEIEGDYDGTYYKDAMGLFGYVVNGKVKNLTVDNFSSDGEYTPTGVIAAYAVNSTFENIAITNCNPRVYNTGNGGIIGIAGQNNDTGEIVLKNITVDNSNKISALWGSWDVACGGLVGMFRGNADGGSGKIHFENCHVAAQIDVNNDVCANYQYYAYRYAGMMIGSVRHNDEKDGHVYPNMAGITAKNCTVHFGDWNDYYYCELVANSLASYTHDHQFSRLTQVQSVDVENKKVTDLKGETSAIPASGRYNYVVVNGEHATENAVCYHFVDGVQHKHDVADSDNPEVYETVNGTKVLKENNQHIYLEFNNLFTGYGWGVTSKGVEDFAGITNMDITTGDEDASIDKFKKNDTAMDEYTSGATVTVGELFEAIGALAVKSGQVQVFVSPAEEGGSAGGTYVANADDWTQGTLTFKGVGAAKISITDYYYCKTTTIDVEILSAEKFEVVFENTNKYLYRVGNQNAVALGSLFAGIEGAEISSETVEVAVKQVTQTSQAMTFAAVATAEEGQEYTFTENADWKQSTIKFDDGFTGPVAVTVKDETSNEVTLYLEVVNAYNVTAASGGDYPLKNRNSVLLNNITMATNGNFWLENATLYGNGFVFDVTAGKDGDTTNGYIGGNYAVALKNATLDNIQIAGEVYTQYGAQAKAMYNYPTILTNGNSVIANSYVSNGASPVRAQDGNLEIINSTLEGGIFANLDIRGGVVTLDDVVTINQSNADGSSTSNDKGIVGLGIVFYECNVNAKLHVKTNADGSPRLTQFNMISKNTTFNDTTVNSLKSAMFGENHKDLQYKDKNDVVWINPCIVSATEGVGEENIDTIKGYTGKVATVAGKTGYVYTLVPSTDKVNPDQYESLEQYNVLPTVTFDHEAVQNYKAPSAVSNEYCYYNKDTQKLEISFDQGKNKVYDPNILTVTKVETLPYTVKIDGVDYTGKTITFNEAGAYTAVYSYTDPYNFRVKDGKVEQFSIDYTKTVEIEVSVVEAAAKNAKFTFYGYDAISTTAKITVTDVKTVSSNSGNLYIMPSSSNDSTVTSTTIDGITVNCPKVYVDFQDNSSDFNWLYPVFLGVKIEDYADGGTADTATTIVSPTSTSKPSNLTILTVDKPSGGGGWSSGSGKSGYEGTLPEGESGEYKGLYGWISGALGSDQNANNIYCQFTYKDNKGTTYYYVIEFYREKHDCPSCITPDTLITLANGEQVRVDSLTGNEELLVWNMETGKLDSAPIMFLDSDPKETFEIVHLYFSDGTDVKVIYEHGFWDYDLNRYVYLDANAADYIGHTFAKQNGDELTKVQLTDVVLETELTTAWSPVTAGHLCYFVNGMLSMPGGVGGLFNIFEVDPETMTYDFSAMERDIEKYGLFTYEEMNEIVPLPEEMFNAAGGAYLKISIGKGNMTMDDLAYMIERYTKFFE